MAILVLASASGAPGVTTLAVGLALSWPRPVLLADCDPSAPQAVLAGYLAGCSPAGQGLLRVAEAHRDGRSLPEVVLDQTLPLGTTASPDRLFLPGFDRPGLAGLFTGVWPALADAFTGLSEQGYDVIVDAGRIVPGGIPAALLDRAYLTGLVLRSDLRAIAAAQAQTRALRDHPSLESRPVGLGLIVVGPRQPYGTREISRSLHLPVIADIPYDPVHARHFSDGLAQGRRFAGSRFNRSLQSTASSLAGRFAATTELVG